MTQQKSNSYFSSIDEFTFLNNTTIGKGSFGKVKLAFHLRTNRIYAIKIVPAPIIKIDLNSITTSVGFNALENEINLHPGLDHPHIIKLWDVIEDKKIIYLVMEHAENGNLFAYQNKKQVFSESQTYVFFSQVLSAIKYLHSIDIMHRDLKVFLCLSQPENLLLDKDLNIKLCDFGWVAEGINTKRDTFCGTYEYMAPQMIQGKQYDYHVDIWALGIFLYELLHGFAPFEGDNAEEVKLAMINGQVTLGPHLSEEITDLIEKILKISPQSRLSLQEIENHPWMHKQIIKNSLIMIKSLKSAEEIVSGLEKDNVIISNNFTGRANFIEQDKTIFRDIKNKDNEANNQGQLDRRMKYKKKPQTSAENIKLQRKMIKMGSIKHKDHIYNKDKIKQNGKCRIAKCHKIQKSQVEFKNTNRVFTQGNQSKKIIPKKKQPVRFNTEMNDTTELICEPKQTLKKKKLTKKKTANIEQPFLTRLGLNYLRKSLEFS